MENFFALLQKNVLNRHSWTTRMELRIAIVTWIERKYHRQRRPAALGRLTPVELETMVSTSTANLARLNLPPESASAPFGRDIDQVYEHVPVGGWGPLRGYRMPRLGLSLLRGAARNEGSPDNPHGEEGGSSNHGEPARSQLKRCGTDEVHEVDVVGIDFEFVQWEIV